MKRLIEIKSILIMCLLALVSCNNKNNENDKNISLYEKTLSDKDSFPEILLNDVSAQYTAAGLQITGKNDLVRLNNYYALGERLVRYRVKFSADAQAVFQSNTGDFKTFLDVPAKTISIATEPEKKINIPFLNPEHEYWIEIYHVYQLAKVKIIDAETGESEETDVVNDGTGGVGQGAVQTGFSVGMQFDYYCFGLQNGTSLLVKEINVKSLKGNLWLLLYGDSITQPESYFPANDFPQSWTQLIMKSVKGNAVSSGRGGGNINNVLEYIKNELPYLKAKYVMVTIGTNGGNTEENLSELVEYILSQGSIPILNNIPCNESGTQIENNLLIEQVRQKYGIKGCKFDWVTSLNNDGIEVDTSTMWDEDFTKINDFGHIYHHPNVKGSLQMFNQTLIDTPEIYEK